MRELIFRAKAKNKKCWVFGDLIHCENGYGIIEKNGGCIKVKPETIGQCTGLKDKNCKKIFEGDIVKYEDDSGYPSYDVFVNVGVIEYCGNAFWVSNRNRVDMQDLVYDAEGIMECEVIGNIYDNKLEEFYE